MTIELSQRRMCIEAGSFGMEIISPCAYAAQSEDGTIIRADRVAKGESAAGHGAFSVRGSPIAAKEIDRASDIGGREFDGCGQARP